MGINAYGESPGRANVACYGTSYAKPRRIGWVKRFLNWLFAAWPGIRVPDGRFLIWLSGGRRQILAECPTERPKYAGLGATILISAVMASLSLAFVLVTVLNVALWVTLPFVFAWGAAILSLERLFVVSMTREGSWLAQLLRATPRVLLSLLLGFVVSTPLVLQILKPEINAQIALMRQEDTAAYHRQLETSPLQLQINKDQAEVSALENQAAAGSPGVDQPQDPALKALNSQLVRAEARQTADYQEWQCQLYGTASNGEVCKSPGNGPLAQADYQRYQSDSAQVALLNQQISQLKASIQAKARTQLPAAQQRLQAAENEQALETSDFNSSNRNDDGLLIRLQALDAVTAGNSTLLAVRWLLFLLFVVIYCMPVLIKVMLNLGPAGNYDRMLADEEKKQLRVAARRRTLWEAAEIMAAERETRSKVAEEGVALPEGPQSITATWARVEAQMQKTWEAWENEMQEISGT